MYEFVFYAAPLVVVIAGVFGFKIGRGKRVADQAALDELGRDLPTLLIDYEETKRKADEYFAKIEEVIGERETWRELYNDQSGGHENAQALMLRTIDHLCFHYKKATGKSPPKLDPMINVVLGEWSSEHGKEARAERGDDGQRRPAEAGEPA